MVAAAVGTLGPRGCISFGACHVGFGWRTRKHANAA
jgi:hypothetical protein